MGQGNGQGNNEGGGQDNHSQEEKSNNSSHGCSHQIEEELMPTDEETHNHWKEKQQQHKPLHKKRKDDRVANMNTLTEEIISRGEPTRREKLFQIAKRVNQQENQMVEMKKEIDLRSQTIVWTELAWRKLRFRSAKSGRGCEDLWSEQDVG